MARRTKRRVTDALWARVAGLRPERPARPKGGRPWADDRECLEGIVWVLSTGSPWQAMPADLPSGSTCWRRLRDWAGEGVFEALRVAILEELAALGRLDLSQLVADATFVRAKRGATTSGTRNAARG